jgi:hypothetical protein
MPQVMSTAVLLIRGVEGEVALDRVLRWDFIVGVMKILVP